MNWRTTLWGVVGIVAVLSSAAVSFHTTGHFPDLSTLIGQLAPIALGMGLYHAKDAKP